MKQSAGEAEFELHCRASGIKPIAEHIFAPPRKWRADFAFPDAMLLVEIEGGAWSGGRHTRGAGFIGDMEKYNAAAMLGWKILRFTPQMVKKGEAIRDVLKILQAANPID